MTEEAGVPDDAAEVLGRALTLLRRADLALQSTKEPPLRKVGVSGSLYAILGNLHVTPGLTGAELARLVGVTPQAVGPLVSKLVDRGWVERRSHPRHANVQELHLTAVGQREYGGADQVMVHLDRHMRDSLGEDRYQDLCGLLDDFTKHLRTWSAPDVG
ncbi:MarR family winged helix-turn-helix transcriptional regulator [Lentzea sp. NPDC058450]|uniref:MarR family winged helix-turn-helix transcriptional regulator n=1 Tax=Lentzea sp. NPDC058450 TaxID=3346505 RepID=UPI003650EBEA